jgi:hypothetical protein
MTDPAELRFVQQAERFEAALLTYWAWLYGHVTETPETWSRFIRSTR